MFRILLLSLRYLLGGISALLILTTMQGQAQTGTVIGTIRDAESGEILIGSSVMIIELNRGTSTDLEGGYVLSQIPSGTYTMQASYVGYTATTITDITVVQGKTLRMDFSLHATSLTTKEVVVTAERQSGTETAVLAQRRKSAVIGDGVSAEQIKLTPDATTGDALRRVIGISLVDNKFIFVRGVTDRYNGAMVNGVSVTSTDTDVDKRSFSFDLLPANLIENTVVVKTATPDLPADFTGGLVQVNTLDFPDHSLVKLSLSSSWNSLGSGSRLLRSQSGTRDWMGFDDGHRAFPAGETNQWSLGKQLPNSWAQKDGGGPMALSFALHAGDRMDYDDGQFGYIAALTYRNGLSRTETENTYSRQGTRILWGGGVRDTYSVLWGGLLNLSWKFSGLHKISWKNTLNQSADDRISSLRLEDENENDRQVHVSEWDQRTLYISMLKGEHHIPDLFSGADLSWRLSYQSSFADEPDRKTFIYTKNIRAQESERTLERGDRSWSSLDEFTRGAGMDFSVTFGRMKAKAGALFEKKERYFDIRFYLAELGRDSREFELLLLPFDSIFAPENFGPGRFQMTRLSDPRDVYTAEQTVLATYLMMDTPFDIGSASFRIAGGARVENSDQRVNTIDPTETNKPYVAVVRNIDILPSVNLTWLATPMANLRMAYSQSVNRPEFRELSSFYFYDYSVYEGTFGNPGLRRALSRNYDLRAEYFPDAGEVLAVSYFYKDITDAIEQRILISSNPERTWFNSASGSNYGWEIEARKNFGFLGDDFSNVLLTVNYARITSRIEYIEGYKVDAGGGRYEDRFRTATREMQGQSPYMLNLSLLVRIPHWGTGINLLVNQFGKRLEAVGDRRDEDVYELPRPVVDLSLTQAIVTGMDVKLSIRDLFPEDRIFQTREGNPYRKVRTGSSYSLQISYGL